MSAELVEHLIKFANDPLGFVKFVFPWGQPGPLRNEDGPDVWQTDILETIGKLCREGKDQEVAQQLAVKSGHGIGKTALIAWIIIWFLTTRPYCQIVVTANTKPQLDGKTWREVAKWAMFAVHASSLRHYATRLYMAGCEKTWFAAAVPWSKENAQAFAGTHEAHVLIVFDEASTIDDLIWETADGAMTTTGAWWIVFGNPTHSTGRFRECFAGGRFAKRWITKTVDSRNAKKANKVKIQQWIEDYGEDDDYVRIRVRGEFPRQSSRSIVSSDLVEQAMKRPMPGPEILDQFPRILGVDVARFGENQTVITDRNGIFVRQQSKYRGIDTQQVASIVVERIKLIRPNAVFIDAAGLGAGVYDRVSLLGYNVVEIQSAARATEVHEYSNKRAEMWFRMATDLKRDYVLPYDDELREHLIGPIYTFDAQNRRRVERKEDMMARNLESPDCADSLALTYSDPVTFQMKSIPERQLARYGTTIYGSRASETSWMSE